MRCGFHSLVLNGTPSIFHILLLEKLPSFPHYSFTRFISAVWCILLFIQRYTIPFLCQKYFSAALFSDFLLIAPMISRTKSLWKIGHGLSQLLIFSGERLSQGRYRLWLWSFSGNFCFTDSFDCKSIQNNLGAKNSDYFRLHYLDGNDLKQFRP